MSKLPWKSPQIPFYRTVFENQKVSGTTFQTKFFIKYFEKNLSFVMLHKLAKSHFQTVLTSQVFTKISFLFHAGHLMTL